MQKVRTKYGDNLTELQQAALDSEIGSGVAGKNVAVPVVVDDVRPSGEGAVDSIFACRELTNPTRLSAARMVQPHSAVRSVFRCRASKQCSSKKGRPLPPTLPCPSLGLRFTGRWPGVYGTKKTILSALIPLHFLDVR